MKLPHLASVWIGLSLLGASVAGADGSTSSAPGLTQNDSSPHVAPTSSEVKRPFAIALNPPFYWKSANSIGASAYVAVTQHAAVRANFATYSGQAAGDFAGVTHSYFGGDTPYGRTYDAGVGMVYFVRRLWSGPTLEAGALRRGRDVVTYIGGEQDHTSTKTTTYAGRALIGWSWLVRDRVFVSAAAGASVGYETGTEVEVLARDVMPMAPHAVARGWVAAEGYIRIGYAFGL